MFRRVLRLISQMPAWPVAVVAGGFASRAGAAPTGTARWDVVLLFAFAAITVLAASRARRWVVLSVSTIAMALVGVSVWLPVAAAGVACGIASGFVSHRSRLLNAVGIALSVQALLRLPAFGFFGLPSLVAGLAALLCWYGGYQMADASIRRYARRATAGIAVATMLAVAVGAGALLDARSDVSSGVSAARRGLQAGRDADPEALASELQSATGALRTASDRLDSLWVKPLRLIPIAAQHRRAAGGAVGEGGGNSETAAIVAVDADLSSLTGAAGQVDVTALAEMEPELSELALQLERADRSIKSVRSPWLLPQFGRQLDGVVEDIDRALPETRIAAEATRVLPGLLGADGPQRYLVMFGTPTEAREFGGLLGSFGLIEVNNGQISLIRTGRVARLGELALANGLTASDYPDWYVRYGMPSVQPQNITASPSGEVVARAARELWNGLDGRPLDGIVYLDMVAVADLLEITGPVDTTLMDGPLTAENAEQFFYLDQYEFASRTDRNEAFSSLSSVASAVLDRMSSRSVPGPELLGRVLGPAARGGHLQIFTFDDAENEFLRSIHLQRVFGAAQGQDFVGLVHTNVFGNKLDLFMRRSLSYDAEVDDAGVVQATATATFVSVVPPNVPTYVLGREETASHNRIAASFYSPHVLVEARLDGVTVGFQSTEELGLNRYTVDLTVAPDGTPRVLSLNLVGAIDPSQPYSLRLWRQPLVNDDEIVVRVTGEQTTSFDGALTEDLVLGNEPQN